MGADIKFERDLLRARHLQIGACRLDRALNQVHDGERCTRLMPKAAAVLEVMIHFAGQPVSRERLLLEVWRGEFPTEDVVTNAISQLRKAFGDGTRDSRYIRTVARVGYALLADVAAMAESGSTGELAEAAVDVVVAPDIEIAAAPRADACGIIPLNAMLTSMPARRPVHAVWVALFLILLALAVGILIGASQRRAAQAPHHLVPLGDKSVPANVTSRHATFVPQATVAFSLGIRRDGACQPPRSSTHRLRTRGHAWI